MKRTTTTILATALVAALAACGSDSKASQPTTPAMTGTEPVGEPTTPPAAEPAVAAEPPAPTYLHGKWVWFELNTPDVAKAEAFYGPLLGWTIAPKEMGGMKYSAITANGKEIGLIQVPPADAKAKKLALGWMGYLSVADVDAAVTTATEKGGAVVMPAMDMPEIGRFAVVNDPAGASFGLVKTTKGDEADKMPASGEWVWMEHWSKDKKKVADAVAFYTAVGGYETETAKMGKDDYTLAKAAGAPRLGFGKASKASYGGRFAPYVVVANVDETVKAATKAKAKVVMKAMDVPNVGRVAVLADPQGALFGILTMPSADASAAPATGEMPPAEGAAAPAGKKKPAE